MRINKYIYALILLKSNHLYRVPCTTSNKTCRLNSCILSLNEISCNVQLYADFRSHVLHQKKKEKDKEEE